ncbi:MAG: hypothetical protein K6C68_10210 [Ruminococcus sp.]|nr:hypothetical protein [Ruminococcus sp.]
MARGVAIIIIIIGVMLVIAGIAIVVYAVVYKNLANKRVREFNQTGVVKKAPPSPLAVFLIMMGTVVLSLVVVLFIGVLSFSAVTNTSEGVIEYRDSVNYAAMRVSGKEDMLENISPEEDIPGYTRSEVQSNDILYVYYTNNMGAGSPFPFLFVYVEYTGEKAGAIHYETDFTYTDDTREDVTEDTVDGKSLWLASECVGGFDGSMKLSAIGAEKTDGDTNYDMEKAGVLEIDFGQFYR